jgi:hypothetical protein
VIADPPVDAGATQVTVAWPSALTALANVGAPGTVDGITAVDELDADEFPFTLVATTVKV